ncbi:MAG: hypothetical protein M9938_07165 [Solirubrobacterales bacterium]|nr:hypothetical protein [Solirubrobacterales bacterium]
MSAHSLRRLLVTAVIGTVGLLLFAANPASADSVKVPLNVTVSGPGSGTVYYSDQVACGAGGSDCSADVWTGDEISLTAIPSDGSWWGGWTIQSGDSTGDLCEMPGMQCAFTVMGPTTVEAKFIPAKTEKPSKSRLHLGKLRLNRRNGTAILAVETSGSGRVSLRGSSQVKSASARANKTGKAKLRIAAKGKALRQLKRHGHTTVTLKITFRPGNGGTARTKSRTVKLIKT